MKYQALPLLFVLSAAVPALAGTEAASSSTAASDPFPGNLTGDWWGTRTKLADHGVTLDVDWTNYYQGLTSGDGDKSWEYGGRFDGYLNFNTEKAGLWDGGMLKLHAEYFYGDLNPNLGSTVAPTNLGVRLPNPGLGDDLDLTNIALSQKLWDANLIIGKINTVDLLTNDPFFGGGGVSRFQNLTFAAPPNGLLPPVIMGAILSVPTGPVGWTLMVYDPDDRTQDYWPDDLFSNGVNVSLGAKLTGKIAGRTSSAALTGIYSTADGVNLGEVLLPSELSTGTKSDSWHASLQLGHYLCEPEPGKGWGLFVKFGISDGNPNPYQGFVTGGLGGKGLFPTRPDDSFGLGYFYYNLSDDLQDALDPLAQIDDEQGVEIYYNYAVTPWFHLTADVQVVNPAIADADNAVVCGLRGSIRF